MAKKAASPAQLAARARFAAMARSVRGTVSAPGFGFRQRVHHARGGISEAFHRMKWGVAALSFGAGYFLPSTLSNLGLGWILYNRIPGYSSIVDPAWAYVDQMRQSGQVSWNPWDNGGVVALGKLTGAGYIGKKIYDIEQGGKIGQGSLNVGMPFALGMLLDGPELSPMAGHIGGGEWAGGGMAPAEMGAQGGVSW